MRILGGPLTRRMALTMMRPMPGRSGAARPRRRLGGDPPPRPAGPLRNEATGTMFARSQGQELLGEHRPACYG
jgi:hypothetical protein